MTAAMLAVTGATGFVGRHVVRLAHEAGYDVWAVGREETPPDEIAPMLSQYSQADLTAEWPVTIPVDAVIHLAGLAAVGPSFSAPQRYIEANSRMVTAMCEAILASGHPTRTLIVSSGAVYDPRADGRPIDESSTASPNSPYAVAKLLVESQAAYYRHRGMDVSIARPFNHIGPGQGLGFLLPDLTHALKALGEGEPLHVGNLDTARDYTDVRDVARAYLTIVSGADRQSTTYNVASGDSLTGREILVAICEELKRPLPPIEVDAARLRPGDPERITGSAELLRAELGWRPMIGWRRSLADFIAALDVQAPAR